MTVNNESMGMERGETCVLSQSPFFVNSVVAGRKSFACQSSRLKVRDQFC
jgi:hypothetical protein